MRQSSLIAISVVLICSFGTAHGDVTFSEIYVESSFSPSHVFSMSTGGYFDSLYFSFPTASVGDSYEPLRSGSITFSYVAEADTDLLLDGLQLRAVGTLLGTGLIEASGQVEDLQAQTIVATSTLSLGNTVQFPYLQDVIFEHPTARVRVTQTFVISAPEDAGLDLASLRVVVHRFSQVPLPEPASLVLLALGAALLRRR